MQIIHGPLLPDNIRAVICGPSNCGKTTLLINLLENSNGLRFENLYLCGKSLCQAKYKYLIDVFKHIPEITCFTCSCTLDRPKPNDVRPHSVVQSYSKIPKQLIRDNANLIILFRQNQINLRHVWNEHVTNSDMDFSTFCKLCTLCWSVKNHNFLVIDKDSELQKGLYRRGFNEFLQL